MRRIITTAVAAGLFGAAITSGTFAASSVSSTDRAPAALVLAGLEDSRAETKFTAYITGYSYWDNTPPGSAAISKPVIHRRAGGTGTYNNPITIAVGHTIEGLRQTLDFKPGTRFYLTRLHKYAIVEDVCGDGNRPQDGPCHTGYRGRPWLDIYIGGKGANASQTRQCANRLTALQDIIMNPRRDYPVQAGEIVESGCKVYY